MSISIFSKVIFTALVFAMYKYYGFLFIGLTLIIRFVISKFVWRHLPSISNVLGALTSLTAPCLLLEEGSNLFNVSNIIGELISLLVVWMTYIFTKYDTFKLLMQGTIFKCDNINITIDMISRCPIFNNSTSYCHPGLLPIPDTYIKSKTVCPMDSDPWLPLMLFSFILTSLQILSMGSILFMNYLSDEVNKLQVSRILHKLTGSRFPKLWKEKNMDWMDDVEHFLDGNLLESDYSMEKLRLLLKYSISNGFLGFTKVFLLKAI